MLTHRQKATLNLTSQMSSFPFPLTEPIVFESCYQPETSGNSNGQAHFTGGEDDVMRRSDNIHILEEESGVDGNVSVQPAKSLWQ